MYQTKIIKTTDRTGHSRIWQAIVEFYNPAGEEVSADEYTDGSYAILKTKTGIEGATKNGKEGKTRLTEGKKITQGKNLGKKNATNAFTQAIAEAEQKYRAYERKNVPKYPPPMLIASTSFAELEHIDLTGCTIQAKYNGVRAVVTLREGEPIAYTRTGKLFKGIPHILHAIRPFLREGFYIDGELYEHETELQTLNSYVRSERKIAPETVGYRIFDVFRPDDLSLPSAQRQEILNDIFGVAPLPHPLYRVENHKVANINELHALYREFINQDLEGAIIRKDDKPYELSIGGYHSKNVLKLKDRKDDDFAVIGYKEGTGGYKGAAIWICVTPDGQEFNVTAAGTLPVKKAVYSYLTKHPGYFDAHIKGKMLNVEYFNLSEDGIPTQPVAQSFRDEITMFTEI